MFNAAQEQPLPSRGRLFFYIPVPEAVRKALRGLAPTTEPSEPDHITLVYLADGDATPGVNVVNRVRTEVKRITQEFSTFQARVTGMAFFDQASNNGKDQTAIVALVSAPSLEPLRTEILRVLRECRLDVQTKWSYTPHITVGWAAPGSRPTVGVPGIVNWDVTRVGMDAPDGAACHPLTGTLAQEAVRTASHAEDRAWERLRLSPRDVQLAQRYLRSKPLPPVDVYIPAGTGHLVASPTAHGHVVTTALGPGMAPRGVPAADLLGPPPKFHPARN